MPTKSYRPRRVRDEDERGMFSSGYIQLDEGEKFLGFALFEGNPAEDEPGYFEFWDHWINSMRRSVPCAEDECPYCEDGERPRTRAKSAWFVLEDSKGNEVNKVMTFNLNGKLIKQFTEFRKEGEKIKGRLFRVALIDDRGTYTLLPKTEVLKVADVKEHLKAIPDYEADLTAQGKKAMEALAVARAMDEDEEPEPEEEETEKPTRATKGAKAKAAPETAEWPDEGDDLEVTVAKVDSDNTIMVESDDYEDQVMIYGTTELDLTTIEEGDTIVLTYVTDEDEDKVAQDFTVQDAEPGAEPEDENDMPDKIDGEVYEVVDSNEAEGTVELKGDIDFTLYILDTMEPDWDDFKEGVKVKVTAEKDTAGDLVATALPEIQKAAARKRTTTKTTTTRRKTAAAKK